jgi:hypothetical protein
MGATDVANLPGAGAGAGAGEGAGAAKKQSTTRHLQNKR